MKIVKVVEDNEEKISHPSSSRCWHFTPWCHSQSPKDAFSDALGDKEFTIRVMEREPKSLEEAFKIAERMELYARKVKPEDKDGFESKLKDLG